jgi:hypothetical protein
MALPVNFDPAAAVRIYNAVRKVEAGDRDQKPLSFPSVTEQGQKRIRLATFTGAWTINTSRIVAFYGATSTAQTAAATNLFIDVPAGNTATPSTTACAIIKERGTWFLLQVQHSTHDVLTGVSLQPTRLEFTRQRVAYVGSTASTTGITITECDNEAASAEQLNFFFG